MVPSASLEPHPFKVTGRFTFWVVGCTLNLATGGLFSIASTPCWQTWEINPSLSVTTSVAVKCPTVGYVQFTMGLDVPDGEGEVPFPQVNSHLTTVPSSSWDPLPSRVAVNPAGKLRTGI